MASETPAPTMDLEVSVTRANDGSLGVELSLDEEGYPIVAAVVLGGPCDRLVQLNDRVLAIEGSEVATAQQVIDELKRNSAATLRVKLRRAAAPAVQPKIFSTSDLTVGAGRTLDVPLIIDEPSVGTYSFTCADAGAIDFSILAIPTGGDPKDASPLVHATGTPSGHGEGVFRIQTACTVIARLDNTASYVSQVKLACVVSLAPLSQVIAAEVAAIRSAQAAHQAHLDTLAGHVGGLLTQEAELEERLSTLRVSIDAAESVHAGDTAHALELAAAADRLLRQPPLSDRPRSVKEAMGASKEMEAAEASVGHGRRVRAMALQSRRSLAARTAAAEATFGAEAEAASQLAAGQQGREAGLAEASRRAEDLAPLMPLQEIYAAFAALAAQIGGAGVALRNAPHVDALFATSRDDLFVLACSGFDLRDEQGARLSTVGTSYCLLLQGRVVPLVGGEAAGGEASDGVLSRLDHFPDAADIVRAAGSLDAEVVDVDVLLERRETEVEEPRAEEQPPAQ